ncbi:MAG: hypothetical protein Fues2KO_53600 [Fuerstiella sp.]
MIRVLKLLAETVQSWWATDRIRVSPFEGRLYQLHPGTQFQWRDQLLVVLTREWDDARQQLHYQLQSADQPAELTCQLHSIPECGILSTVDRTVTIFPDEVTVLHSERQCGDDSSTTCTTVAAAGRDR